jgi:hypothetical protein
VTPRVLISERNGRDTRNVEITSDGNSITITGQDLGPAVERFWGSDEYEWAWRIDLTSESALRELLSIPPPEDLVDGIVARYSGNDYSTLSDLLDDAPFETNFWSYS